MEVENKLEHHIKQNMINVQKNTNNINKINDSLLRILKMVKNSNQSVDILEEIPQPQQPRDNPRDKRELETFTILDTCFVKGKWNILKKNGYNDFETQIVK